ncbi:MAG: hypothetical protein ACFFE2_03935 [Candidatus Thorarchaeota archaeon]
MAIPEPSHVRPTKRNRGMFLYAITFIVITCATAVNLSLRDFISFDPLSSLVAGLFAGIALLMFQLTYLKFVVNSSRRPQRRDPDIV